MAIFNKSDQQTDYSSNITTIASGTHITGKLEVKCELHVDGNVEAEVISSGTVKIGKTGSITSNLRAKTLIVTGKFIGDANCEFIELVSGGEAEGKLTANSLMIDSDSFFQGESIRKQADGLETKIVNLGGGESTNSATSKANTSKDKISNPMK